MQFSYAQQLDFEHMKMYVLLKLETWDFVLLKLSYLLIKNLV